MQAKPITRIDLSKPFDEPDGFDVHDKLRDGRQFELAPRKVSALFKIMYKKINELVDENNRLRRKMGELP